MLINLGNADTAMYQAKRQVNSYQLPPAPASATADSCLRQPKSLSTTAGGLRQTLPVDLFSCRIYPNCRRKWSDCSDWGMGFVHCLRSKSGLAGRWIAPLKWQSTCQPVQAAKSSGNGRPSAQGNKARYLFRTRVDREPGYGKRSTGNRYLCMTWASLFTGRFWHRYSSLNYLKRFPIHALKIDQLCARPCFRLE